MAAGFGFPNAWSFECFNFDAGNLTIHDGKGQKDRTVPLPETITAELEKQME
jgi:integrase